MEQHQVLLEPLDAGETEQFLDELGDVPAELHERIVQAAEGNPLFGLLSLVRKELVRPDRPQLPQEDAYRFRHLLIRDAAYDALSKSTRAKLQQRFAAWLEQHGRDLVELDEILGYHFEQAAQYLAELGWPDSVLAEQAAGRLVAASRRARLRGDDSAVAGLLGRALTLTRPFRLDVHLEVDLALTTRFSSGPADAVGIATDAADRAQAAGDEAGDLLARTSAVYVAVHAGSSGADELKRSAQAAFTSLEAQGDHAGLAVVCAVRATGAGWRGRFEDAAQTAEQAIRHAELAGIRAGSFNFYGLPFALLQGPRSAEEALHAVDALTAEHPEPFMFLRAVLLAMLDRFDEAWSVVGAADRRTTELGLGPSSLRHEIPLLAGDDEAAATDLRVLCEHLDDRGWHGNLSGYGPLLGRVLCRLNRHDEAESLAQRGRSLANDPNDVWAHAIWRQVQALVDAKRGGYAKAEQLAREAVAIVETTDGPWLRADAFYDLGEVLERAGRCDEAAAAYEEALECYARKQIVPLARRTRERLAALQTV